MAVLWRAHSHVRCFTQNAYSTVRVCLRAVFRRARLDVFLAFLSVSAECSFCGPPFACGTRAGMRVGGAAPMSFFCVSVNGVSFVSFPLLVVDGIEKRAAFSRECFSPPPLLYRAVCESFTFTSKREREFRIRSQI